MLLKRGWLALLFFAVCLMGWMPMHSAEAGTFQLLEDSGRLVDMKNNEKWERIYRSADGDIKIRFRRVQKLADFLGQKNEKPYHLVIWRKDSKSEKFNDKKDRIFDWDLRPNSAGYRFQIFCDTKTNKIFIAFDAVGRVQLLGFDPAALNGLRRYEKYTGPGVLQKYVDSVNFYSALPYPEIKVTENNDLQLRFDNLNSNASMPYVYNLTWNAKNNWFGWEDVTNYPRPQMRTYSVGRNESYTSEIPENEEIWVEE